MIVACDCSAQVVFCNDTCQCIADVLVLGVVETNVDGWFVFMLWLMIIVVCGWDCVVLRSSAAAGSAVIGTSPPVVLRSLLLAVLLHSLHLWWRSSSLMMTVFMILTSRISSASAHAWRSLIVKWIS